MAGCFLSNSGGFNNIVLVMQVEETKAKIASLKYIKKRFAEMVASDILTRLHLESKKYTLLSAHTEERTSKETMMNDR